MIAQVGGGNEMPTITTSDGTEIFYKDWGSGEPIVFSHGWPLSADDWDTQMLFFLEHGYRVIAHDRRGHGRSTQSGGGHDMDHYADDLAALTAHLDLRDAIHVGHSTGGGEVVHYIGRHGESRVSKAALISAVPPLMVQTEANPGGMPKSVFDDYQAQLAANRSEFYRAVASGPFYGFNRPGVEPSQAIIDNWWRQGMMGGAKAHYDGIVAFSQTDLTEDLKQITVPVLVMHGEDDQIVPYEDSAPLSAELAPERDAQVIRRLPARHADHRGRHDQRRPAGLPTVLTDSPPHSGIRDFRLFRRAPREPPRLQTHGHGRLDGTERATPGTRPARTSRAPHGAERGGGRRPTYRAWPAQPGARQRPARPAQQCRARRERAREKSDRLRPQLAPKPAVCVLSPSHTESSGDTRTRAARFAEWVNLAGFRSGPWERPVNLDSARWRWERK